MNEYIVCVFGSGGVGKSCLVRKSSIELFSKKDFLIFKTMQFVQNIFLTKYDPTIEDVYKTVIFDRQFNRLNLFFFRRSKSMKRNIH